MFAPTYIHNRTSKCNHNILTYISRSVVAARILGLTEAPPAYVLTPDQSVDPSGMTFAFGGAGVHTVSKSAPTLFEQVNMFTSLVNNGVISKDQLRRSVALVAVSGNDYLNGADVGDAHLSSFNDVSTNTDYPAIKSMHPPC
jgi:hypothetical protein